MPSLLLETPRDRRKIANLWMNSALLWAFCILVLLQAFYCVDSLEISPTASTLPPSQSAAASSEFGIYVYIGTVRLIGPRIADNSQNVLQSVVESLQTLASVEGTRDDVAGITTSCGDYEPFGPEFQRFCSMDVTASVFAVNLTVYSKMSLDSAGAIERRRIIENSMWKAGSNLTGVILLKGTFDPQAAMKIVPLPVKRQFVLSLQLTGRGLLPWSVPKQTAFLLALQRSSDFSNRTRMGFCNISSSVESFADILAASVQHPLVAGRRRLLDPSSALMTFASPSEPGFQGFTGGAGDLLQRRLLLPENSSSVEVYVRFYVDELNQTAGDFWDLVMNPKDSNYSLSSELYRFGMPMDIQFRGAVTALLKSDGQFANFEIQGAPLLSSPSPSGSPQGAPVPPQQASQSHWKLALGLALGLGVALLGAIAAVFLLRRRWQAKKLVLKEAAEQIQADKPNTSSRALPSDSLVSSGSIQWSLPSKHDGEPKSILDSIPGHVYSDDFQDVDASEIEICKRSDGSDWVLGKGTFGLVYMGLRRGVQRVALKQLHSTGCDVRSLQQFLDEVRILQRVSFDKNIIQFYGTCKGHRLGPLLVMEYLESGDLSSNLWRPELRWRLRGQKIALDIARGLHFLHSSKVIHRDLKSSNVLLTREGVAKIGDVGLAKFMTREFFTGDANGTFAYASPELLLGRPCTEKIDIYSLGIVFWEIITGEVPVRGSLRQIISPADCPPAVATLVDDCLRDCPDARPSALEVVQRLKAEMNIWEGGRHIPPRGRGSAANIAAREVQNPPLSMQSVPEAASGSSRDLGDAAALPPSAEEGLGRGGGNGEGRGPVQNPKQDPLQDLTERPSLGGLGEQKSRI